jgi:hypothetical protein
MDDATGKGKQASSSAGSNPSVPLKVSTVSKWKQNVIFIYFVRRRQYTDTTVAANDDLERASSSSALAQPDPFLFRDALKTTPQLADLRRRRKTGKRLEKYHRRQNEVRHYNEFSIFFIWHSPCS